LLVIVCSGCVPQKQPRINNSYKIQGIKFNMLLPFYRIDKCWLVGWSVGRMQSLFEGNTRTVGV